MTEDEASRTLCRYLAKLAGDAVLIDPDHEVLVEVRKDHQEAPRPKGPYAVVEFVTDRDIEEVNGERYQDAVISGEPRVVMCKDRGVEWLFRVNVYASRPLDWTRLFRSGLQIGDASVWMAPLVIRAVGEAKRAPELIQQDWEGRAMLDVTLGAVATEQLLVDVIETGAIEFEGQGGSTVSRSLTFTKP